MDISFIKCNFYIKLLDDAILPEYKGAMFRGGFGYVLKKISCIQRTKTDCDDCILKYKCAYSYIFETPIKKDTKVMKKYPKAPHPFVVEPPLDTKREYKSGSKINFSLILIGKSIDYLPYFIFAFDELGKIGIGKDKAKYDLLKVTLLKNKDEIEIYNNDDKKLLTDIEPTIYNLESKHKEVRKIKIKFITPTRLRYNQKITSDIEFHILMRNVLRRISLITYFHCDEQLQLDYKGIIKRSKEIKIAKNKIVWHDWKRYSTRQKKDMYLGGFKGDIEYEGELTEFLPFLLIGSEIHIGKNSTFGLGKYVVIV